MKKITSEYSDRNFTDSWFTNLTDIHIPPSDAITVSLGKNFGTPIPNNQLPIKQFVADFESNIQKIKEEDRNAARLKFVNCITTFSRYRQTKNPITDSQKKVIQEFKSTRTFLNSNPEHNCVTQLWPCTEMIIIINYNLCFQITQLIPL